MSEASGASRAVEIDGIRAVRRTASAGRSPASACLALLVGLVAGCGPSGPGAPALRHPPACPAARTELAGWQQAIEAGRLHRALDHARAADAACASVASRQAIAEALDALAIDDRAAAAWRAYAAMPGSDRGLADAHLAALARRPPATREANPEDRSTALLLYRDGADQRLRGDLDRAITQLRRSYVLWPHPLTIVQIGLAHQAAGRAAEAQASFERALAIAEATRKAAAEPQITPRHTGDITALAHDAGGGLLASGGDDGQVMLWDPVTGRLIRRLDTGGITAQVEDLAFSDDRARLAAVFGDGSVRQWNTVTGELAGSARLPLPPVDAGSDRQVRIAPRLAAVVVGHPDGALQAFGLDGALRASARAPSIETLDLQFSADGRRLVQVTLGHLVARELDGLRPLRTLDRGDGALGFATALTADGSELIAVDTSGEREQTVRIRLADGARTGVVAREWMSEATLGLSRDGSRLLALDSGEITLWDTARARKLRRIGSPGAYMSAAAFHPDGDRLVCGDTQGTLRVFDAGTGALVRVIGFDTWGINDVGFDARGDRLVMASDHGAIQIWDLDGESRRQLNGHWGWVVFSQFDAAGEQLISGGQDQTIRTWDVRSGKQLSSAQAQVVGKGNQAFAVAAAASRTLVASVVMDPLRHRWNLVVKRIPGGQPVAEIGEDQRNVEAERNPTVVALDPAGSRVAVGFEVDRRGASVQLFAVAGRGRALATTPVHGDRITALAFSADGALLATTSSKQDEGIRIWRVDPATGALAEHAALAGHAADHAVELLFLPGDRLASVGRDHRVIVWDLAARAAMFALEHAAVVTGVALTPDGRTLATSSKDRTVRLWDATGGAPVGTLMPTRGGQWLVLAADGRVDGSDGAARLLYWKIGDVELPGFVAWDRQRRPGLLRELLRGRRTGPAAGPAR